MKIASIRTLIIAAALLGVAPHYVNAQPSAPPKRTSAPPKPITHYHVVHGWPVLPENTRLQEVSAVAVDSHDNVLVLHRGGRKWPASGALRKL